MLTFRLYDSLPKQKIDHLNDPRLKLKTVQIRNALESCCDAGLGACYLRDPRIAALMQNALLHFDGERYWLLAWVVMPNHVHVLAQFDCRFSVPSVLHSWKSFVAHHANKLLGRSGPFWQREYFDRFIRNEEHYRNAVSYIEANPVKAGLAALPEEWRFSSALLRSFTEKSAPIA